MLSLDELTAVLSSTFLGGRPVEMLDFDRLLVRIDPDEVWPAWQAARSVVPASGRWPVAHCGWEPYVELTDVLPNPPDDGTTVVLAADLDPMTGWYPPRRDEALPPDWAETLVRGWGLDDTRARAFIERGASLDDVERDRFEHRLAEVGGDVERLAAAPHLTDREHVWFTPSGQATGIVFLTTPDPVAALADVDYYGGAGAGLVAIGQQWHARYGAELVAAWGTMLQFVARRRPVSPEDAWDLAGQQLTVGGSLQMRRDDLAIALLHTDFWFLHDRP